MPKKIVFVVGTLASGGAERQLYYVLKTLAEQGSKVWVLCLTQKEAYQAEVEKLNVPVIWVGGKKSPILRLAEIIKWCRRINPEVIHSSHFYTNPYVSVAGLFCRASSVLGVRNDFLSEISGKYSKARFFSLIFGDLIVANSESAIGTAIRYGIKARKIKLLENVVDTEEFSPAAKKNENTIPIILCVGRLEPQKNHMRVLNILRGLLDRGLEFQGLIVGDGSEKQNLIQIGKEYGLSDRLQWASATKNIVDYYRKSDVLLHLPLWEGTPNVVLEAMACSLPILCSDVGDVGKLMVNGKTGFLFAEDQDEKILDMLSKVIQNAEMGKRLGRNGRNKQISERSLKGLHSRLEMIYSK